MRPRNNTWKTPAGLWKKLKPQTRRMRQEPTVAEGILWERLRGKKLSGIRFRRQHPIDRFIVDFYAPEVKLAIELDGPIHLKRQEQDEFRQARLEELGCHVIRFENEEVFKAIENVIERIESAVTGLMETRKL